MDEYDPLPEPDDRQAMDYLDEEQQESAMSDKKVLTAISRVMELLAKEGIGKDRKNEQQGYKFRGIDDVYNALAPALVAAKLIVVPKCLSRECVERTSAKGGALFYITVQATFAMFSAEDGSSIEAGPFYGEAMDSGDKATNKAMSAAYKYWAMQTFAIPTEGDNDADATTHEVVPASLTADEELRLQELRDASLNGVEPLKLAWGALTEAMRTRLRAELPALKTAAARAEKKAA